MTYAAITKDWERKFLNIFCWLIYQSGPSRGPRADAASATGLSSFTCHSLSRLKNVPPSFSFFFYSSSSFLLLSISLPMFDSPFLSLLFAGKLYQVKWWFFYFLCHGYGILAYKLTIFGFKQSHKNCYETFPVCLMFCTWRIRMAHLMVLLWLQSVVCLCFLFLRVPILSSCSFHLYRLVLGLTCFLKWQKFTTENYFYCFSSYFSTICVLVPTLVGRCMF